MPRIYEYKCDRCGFKTPDLSNGCLYVINGKGEEFVVPHPCEWTTVAKVLDIPIQYAMDYFIIMNNKKVPADIMKRIGDSLRSRGRYICFDCLEYSMLDDKKEVMKCKKCGSDNLIPFWEMDKHKCPKCKVGNIEKNIVGVS